MSNNISQNWNKAVFDFEKDFNNDKKQYKILKFDIPDLYFLKNSNDKNYSNNYKNIN